MITIKLNLNKNYYVRYLDSSSEGIHFGINLCFLSQTNELQKNISKIREKVKDWSRLKKCQLT